MLGLDDNGITAQEAVAIYDMMICLEELYISSKRFHFDNYYYYEQQQICSNKFGDLGAELLSKRITNTKTLRVLHINIVGLSGITAITNALVSNSSLENLNLNNDDKLAMRIVRNPHHNAITKVELPNILKSYDDDVIDIRLHEFLTYQVVSLGFFLSKSHQKKWKKLNLLACFIGDHGMSILHKYLCGDKTNKLEITEINLSRNNLTGASSPLIADIISHLEIHALLLHDNNITNLRDISTAVITSSTLKVLDLNDNGITAQEAVAIYDMMICLEELYISSKRFHFDNYYEASNKLGDLGAELLSKRITNTKTLRVLHINIVGLSGITAITNALVSNSSLENLNLNNDDKLAMRIVRSPHHNTITKVELPNILKSYDDVIDIRLHELLPYQVVSLGFFLSKSHQNKWKKLNLSWCHIGDHGMSILHQYLCGDKTTKLEITEIDLSENNLTGASSPLIADIISHLEIHTLLLHDNNITNLRDISTAAINSSTLKVLNLDGNGIIAQEAVAISDMMICLEKLYISDCRAEVLYKGIINTITLRELHINNTGPSVMIATTDALVNNNSLEEVNLNAIRIIRTLHHNNNITKFELNMPVSFYSDMIDISGHRLLPHQVASLGLFLSKSHQRKWNLSNCHIGDHGISIFHEYFCKDKASKQEIIEINLSENDLTGASSPLIADIISHLQVHTLLLCNNNDITNVRDISTAVVASSTLKVLCLNDNYITAQEAVAISDMMICLEELYISNNRLNRKLNTSNNEMFGGIGDHGAELLSKGITNTTTLRVLHIADNNIGPSGAIAIANALVNNTSLEELNMNDNDVEQDGVKAIAKAITSKKTLKTLLLYGDSMINYDEAMIDHNNTSAILNRNKCNVM